MRRTGEQGAGGSIEAVDSRTGRAISVTLDERFLQVVEPDRTSDRGVWVTDVPIDDLVLVGTVAGRVRGRRGGWVITRSVALDDPQWGACAPAWSWVLLPQDPGSRRPTERFLKALRAALPRERWAGTIRLSKPARTGRADAAGELLDLARRRDPAFAATCDRVVQERLEQEARLADHAEQVLREALHWRTGGSGTTITS
jgi:hypothetical protein